MSSDNYINKAKDSKTIDLEMHHLDLGDDDLPINDVDIADIDEGLVHYHQNRANGCIELAHCKICNATIIVSNNQDKSDILCSACAALYQDESKMEECVICHKKVHPLISVGETIKACFNCLSDIKFKEMYSGDSASYARTEEALESGNSPLFGVNGDKASKLDRELDDIYMSTLQGQSVPVYDMFRILSDLDVVVTGSAEEEERTQAIVNEFNRTVPISKENKFYSVKVTKGDTSLTEPEKAQYGERTQIYMALETDEDGFLDDIYDKLVVGEFITLEMFDRMLDYIDDDVIISMGDPRFFNMK